MIRASKIRHMMQKWVQMKEQHTALVEELKIMEEQVEQLQAKLVAKKREVMILRENRHRLLGLSYIGRRRCL